MSYLSSVQLLRLASNTSTKRAETSVSHSPGKRRVDLVTSACSWQASEMLLRATLAKQTRKNMWEYPDPKSQGNTLAEQKRVGLPAQSPKESLSDVRQLWGLARTWAWPQGDETSWGFGQSTFKFSNPLLCLEANYMRRAAFWNSHTELSTVWALCWVTLGNSLFLSEPQFLVPLFLQWINNLCSAHLTGMLWSQNTAAANNNNGSSNNSNNIMVVPATTLTPYTLTVLLALWIVSVHSSGSPARWLLSWYPA